jgi:hypothetical protein
MFSRLGISQPVQVDRNQIWHQLLYRVRESRSERRQRRREPARDQRGSKNDWQGGKRAHGRLHGTCTRRWRPFHVAIFSKLTKNNPENIGDKLKRNR